MQRWQPELLTDRSPRDRLVEVAPPERLPCSLGKTKPEAAATLTDNCLLMIFDTTTGPWTCPTVTNVATHQ
jgi:hypothetical protein